MNRTFWIISGVLLAVTLFAFPLYAQDATPESTPPLEFTIRTDPVSLVGAYYNAISRGEYERAYSYWEEAPRSQTETQFAQGFVDTARARAFVRLPIFSDAGAGNVFASIPTLVAAVQTDGSQEFYAGCFIAHKTNVPEGDAAEPDPNWYLREGSLNQQETLDFSALDSACEDNATLASNPFPPGQLDPAQLVTSYFAALVTGNSGEVAPYWENPAADVLAQQYGAVLAVAGDVSLYVDPAMYAEGAAGSVYASIPTLTRVTAEDGSAYFIIGCFTARKSNVPVGDAAEPDPNWRFVGVTTSQSSDAASAASALPENCAPQA